MCVCVCVCVCEEWSRGGGREVYREEVGGEEAGEEGRGASRGGRREVGSEGAGGKGRRASRGCGIEVDKEVVREGAGGE